MYGIKTSIGLNTPIIKYWSNNTISLTYTLEIEKAYCFYNRLSSKVGSVKRKI